MNETADWSPLGEMIYRRSVIYDSMHWSRKIDLSKNLVAISQCGGLIAMMKDENLSGGGASINRDFLSIYNAAGILISNFRWNSGTVIGLEWTHKEDLMCIQDDGQVLLYSMHGEFMKVSALGNECRDSKVIEYKTFLGGNGTGLVVLNGLYRFYLVRNVYDVSLRRLSDIPGLRTAPSSWCVLAYERDPRVLAANENEIYLLKLGGDCTLVHPTDMKAKVASFTEMSASLNGKYVVLYTDSGIMWMGSSDFHSKYCEFNTNNGSRPRQLLWCCDHLADKSPACLKNERTSSAVIIYWPKTILLVDLGKNWARFPVEEPSDGMPSWHLKLDVGGVHLVSTGRHEFIQRVPPETEAIFKIGSMDAGSLLLAAEKEFKKGSQKSDEYIRLLIEKDDLELAIRQCLAAAESEFNPNTQKTLLRAATFGKAFHPHEKMTQMFVEVCKTLRLLNNIRDDKVGILLTAKQLELLNAGTVIDRLIFRKQFALAYEICRYLKVPENQGSSRVLAHWACYKVQQSENDDEGTARSIKNKLQHAKEVSYASVAEKAVDCNKKNLAVKLLEYEPRASEQVRLLIKLGMPDRALEKAVASGNTDLIQEVIGRLRERRNLSDFLLTIRQHPTAYRLLLKSCQEQKLDMVKHLYEQEDDFLELAHCYVRESFGTFSPEDRIVSLQEALSNFQKCRDDFCTKATEDHLKLVRQQMLLEEESDQSYVETSLHDTLTNLLLAGNLKKAEFLRKEFKVSDKRWWNLRINSLAQLGHFTELESFAKSKKSPVGYICFIEACAKYGAFQEIPKYINKVPQDQRVLALIKAKNIRAAGDAALQSRNIGDLDMVLKRCGVEHRDVAEKVVAMLNQLQRP